MHLPKIVIIQQCICIGLLATLPGLAYAGEGQLPLVRLFHPPVSPQAEVTYEDLDLDGDPDVLRTRTAQGFAIQWIDDDDDMTASDRTGDSDSDCLMVDINGDGQYGGPQDFNVDWGDEDGDGKADIQIVVDNGDLTYTPPILEGPHFMIFIDTDHDGVMGYIDWRDFVLKCWGHSGHCRFFPDYLGQSMFLKAHYSTWDI